MTITLTDLEKRFTYHPPKEDSALHSFTQSERYVIIRDKAKDLGETVLNHTPSSREQSVAITKLEEVVFWANAAIARNE